MTVINMAEAARAMKEKEAAFQAAVQAACFDMIGFALQHIFDHVKLKEMNDLTLHEAQTLLDLAFQEAKERGKVWRANLTHLKRFDKKITGFKARFDKEIYQLTIDPVF